MFLNACASVAAKLPYTTSFALMFIQNENRGVIGTQMVIPDGVASVVAQRFYRELFAGANAGHALVEAKHHLASTAGNPLGLAYVMYADPDLHVDEPLPKEAIT